MFGTHTATHSHSSSDAIINDEKLLPTHAHTRAHTQADTQHMQQQEDEKRGRMGENIKPFGFVRWKLTWKGQSAAAIRVWPNMWDRSRICHPKYPSPSPQKRAHASGQCQKVAGKQEKKNPEKNTTTTSTTPLEPIKWRTKAASSPKWLNWVNYVHREWVSEWVC